MLLDFIICFRSMGQTFRIGIGNLVCDQSIPRSLDKLHSVTAPRLSANDPLAYTIGRYLTQISAPLLALTSEVNRRASVSILAVNAVTITYTILTFSLRFLWN